MSKYYLTKDKAYLGDKIYKLLMNNNIVSEDYFEKDTQSDMKTLQNLFTTFVSQNKYDMKVKIKILKMLSNKESNDIYSFFDNCQTYFNKYYYDADFE